MQFSEVVERVVGLDATINAYWDAELPKRHPKYPLIEAGADDGPPPPEEEELRRFLLSRPTEEVYRLLALTYLGRGDFNAIGVTAVARDLERSFPVPAQAIRQLMSKPLEEYLPAGLHELRRAGLDVDHLEPTAA